MSAHQLALILAHHGMTRAAEHAEALDTGWGERAFEHLCAYAKGRDGTFSSEDFRDHLAAIGFACPVPKALGAVFQKAARRLVIERVGFAPSRDRHCSPIPLWRQQLQEAA